LNNRPAYDPKSLQIIYFALLAFQIAFLLICMVVIEPAYFEYKIQDLTYSAIPILAIIIAFLGNRYFAQGFKNLVMETEINQSLQRLTTIHIVRWAMVEAGTFMLLAATINTSNHYFTAFAMANIAYFITLRPRLFNFDQGLQV